VALHATEGAERAAALSGDVPSIQGAALRCRGLIDRDPEKLLVAVELSRSSGRTLEHAGSCEDAAGVLATAGDHAKGRALLEQALELYESIGASWCTSRASARLREIGGRRGSRGSRQRALTGWESLTRSERAVVELVAEGLTNREVGKRLFISPHTVSSHLRHAFQKLDVSTRAALAAKVSRTQSG
jgi:DNA-binding CsgD family transcriptional regulator